MTAILAAEGVSKFFGQVCAARDITVAIPAGQTVGIIGANGAGKTTFVNMITGYLPPSSGRILFRDKDITGLGPKQITRLGVCRSFQIAQVFPTLTAVDNMVMAIGVADRLAGRSSLFSALRTGSRRERALETLQHYSIADYADRLAGVLPQGVRKLLDIAMAVAAEPQVVMLDEPTSGVSAEEKFATMDAVMHALGESGITVLFVEHDMEIVQRYADRVLAFYDGAIIADDAPEIALAKQDVREFVIGDFTLAQEGGAHA
ncbi:MAG: ATP-binding cassette domain-containing protein [Pseudomonadota bacterium]